MKKQLFFNIKCLKIKRLYADFYSKMLRVIEFITEFLFAFPVMLR